MFENPFAEVETSGTHSSEKTLPRTSQFPDGFMPEPLVLQTKDGGPLRLLPLRTPADIWEHPRVWDRFVGPPLQGHKLCDDAPQAMQTYLAKHSCDAVTNGALTLTCVGDRIVHARPAWLNLDSSAHLDAVISELDASFKRILQETRELSQRRKQLQADLSKMDLIGWRCESLAFHAEPSVYELAQLFIADVLDPKHRPLIGVRPDVAIDTALVNQLFLEPLRQDYSFQHRRRGLLRHQPDEAEASVASRAQFDLEGLVRHLVARYAGAAGLQLVRAEQAKALVSDLGLRNSPFEIKNGKLELDFHFRHADYGDKEQASEQSKTRIARALSGVGADRNLTHLQR